MELFEINKQEVKLYPPVDESIFYRLMSMIVYKNVQLYKDRGNSGTGRTSCFGLVHKRSQFDGLSRLNSQRPEFWEELEKIAKHLPVPEGWTSVQLNQDYPTFRHKDCGNIGPSCIVSAGMYSGGELCITDTSGSISFNTNLRPIVGDFSKLEHYVKPLSGFKISMVFFKCISRKESKKRPRVSQRPLNKEEVLAYADPNHMFNPVPAVRMSGKTRTFLEVDLPGVTWNKGRKAINKILTDENKIEGDSE